MIQGERFGRLVALHQVSSRPKKKWLFACDCGVQRSIRPYAVSSGQTMSCGCRRQEGLVAGRRAKRKHGGYGTVEYVAWASMKRRCYNDKSKGYDRYGGRGIIVCDEWRNSFESFLKYVGLKPSSEYSLERHDCNGNYQPGNVSWIKSNLQARNRRSSLIVEFGGKQMTLAEACERCGADYKLVHARLKSGILLETALLFPAGKLPAQGDDEAAA